MAVFWLLAVVIVAFTLWLSPGVPRRGRILVPHIMAAAATREGLLVMAAIAPGERRIASPGLKGSLAVLAGSAEDIPVRLFEFLPWGFPWSFNVYLTVFAGPLVSMVSIIIVFVVGVRPAAVGSGISGTIGVSWRFVLVIVRVSMEAFVSIVIVAAIVAARCIVSVSIAMGVPLS